MTGLPVSANICMAEEGTVAMVKDHRMLIKLPSQGPHLGPPSPTRGGLEAVQQGNASEVACCTVSQQHQNAALLPLGLCSPAGLHSEGG